MNLSDIIICSDFDGTLTGSPSSAEKTVVMPLGRVNTETVNAVKRFADAGGKFIVVSGRSPASMDFLYDFMPIDDLFAGANGSAIKSRKRGCLVFSRPMKLAPRQFSEKISGFLQDINELHLTDADTTVHRWVKGEEKLNSFLTRFDTALKIIAIEHEPSTMKKIYENLKTALSEVCEVEMSCPFIAECFDKGAGKGGTIRYLKQIYPDKLVVAAGDYDNDAKMLQAADMAFCPENASPEIKKLCKKTFRSSGEGFIADVVDYLEKL